jgi:hypothetical protein
MTDSEITRYITETFEGSYVVTADDNRFFMYDPEGKFPFATLILSNDYDTVSRLERPGVFRLNIGVSKARYLELFGVPFAHAPTNAEGAPDYDFAALDQLLPHPTYGKMYWVCILNPSIETFDIKVKPLLVEAYEADVKKYGKRGE